ncbi:Na(+)/H(+) antiporter NhaA [Dactylosporangium sucinum]|uniref:Na(+)/H(+) antiporter NhaA n=1 Tax=Dactylosporangium sucinum TaxID=1424081 RepID=A0A917X237_9ACTN|nr:Na+/H+ antiporter NhaA [Dactylosporangium sucinum]GGM54845.1 Na(+)/H(+) antiporter NhaA [Dactylosporangium sucinum]
MSRPFERGTWAEVRRIADVLRTETIGGLLLLVAAAAALGWANSPWAGAYHALSEVRLGPSALHLDLTLSEWAADGLLAVFFFVAGLELKREFVAGDLRDPRRALLPVAAAVGGMVVPALVYTAINVTVPDGAPAGWAVPIATDIAFALAVLGVINTHLPASLRTFLLTLAVVDDLLAIVVIAVVFSASLAWLPLVLALLPLAGFAWLAQRGRTSPWLLVPLAVATWALVHASGIHATVAGVLLAFTVPTATSGRFEHRLRPLSAGVAVPVFAFFAAGVTVTGSSLGLAGPITVGVAAGLVLGKTVGVAGTTWLVVRLTRARLAEGLAWLDVIGLALLGGVGFTVSLLVSELAFGAGSPGDSAAKVGILGGSLVAALLAAVVLRARNRHYRRLTEEEETDADGDGVPDAYQ